MSLSAAVTRILTLSGFPPELKTRDIQAAFSDWDNERGGFKIKWVDDTTLMLVFQDAGTAKRAYLSTLFQPPAPLVAGAASGRKIVIKPYDGPEAQQIITNVNSRGTGARGHNTRQSISTNPPMSAGGVGGPVVHKRGASFGGSLGRASGLDVLAANAAGNTAREPSPTLPSLPSHPALGALISSGLSDLTPPGTATEATSYLADSLQSSPPRVGDPARRMVGHALGIRHPGLNKGDSAVKDMEKSMGGLAIMAE